MCTCHVINWQCPFERISASRLRQYKQYKLIYHNFNFVTGSELGVVSKTEGHVTCCR